MDIFLGMFQDTFRQLFLSFLNTALTIAGNALVENRQPRKGNLPVSCNTCQVFKLILAIQTTEETNKKTIFFDSVYHGESLRKDSIYSVLFACQNCFIYLPRLLNLLEGNPRIHFRKLKSYFKLC